MTSRNDCLDDILKSIKDRKDRKKPRVGCR